MNALQRILPGRREDRMRPAGLPLPFRMIEWRAHQFVAMVIGCRWIDLPHMRQIPHGSSDDLSIAGNDLALQLRAPSPSALLMEEPVTIHAIRQRMGANQVPEG